jgi:high-affinity iron transporter
MVFLQQAGIITALDATAWDTSAFLSDTSLFGRVLHTLVGYADQPSQLQVLVYAVVLFGGFGLARLFAAPHAHRARVAAAE